MPIQTVIIAPSIPDPGSGDFRLLIFTDLRAAKRFARRSTNRADVIFIKTLQARSRSIHYKLVRQLLETTGCRGLLIFHSTYDYPQWYKKFISQFTTGGGIVDIVKNINKTHGVFYHTGKLNEETHPLLLFGLSTFRKTRNYHELFLLNLNFSNNKLFSESPYYELEERISERFYDLPSHFDGLPFEFIPTPPAPRYLQAAFRKPQTEGYITDYLLPPTDYQLYIHIGEKDIQLVTERDKIDLGILFENPAISAVDIDLEVICNTQEASLYGKLVLPRAGNSAFAVFPIYTGQTQKTFTAEIFAFHANRLIQKSILEIDIRTENEPVRLAGATLIKEVSLRSSLSDLAKRTPFDTSLIVTGRGEQLSLNGRSGNEPLGFRLNQGIEKITDKIRQGIEELAGVESKGTPALTEPKNVALLHMLAHQGSMLYKYHLKTGLEGPLQIVSNVQDYVPLDFAYTFPPPQPKASLCEHAIAALENGACTCTFSNDQEKAKIICPLAFWGLSRVIERHKYNTHGSADARDYIIKNEPTEGRDVLTILRRTLFGSSHRVDNSKKGLIKKIGDHLLTDSSLVHVADEWLGWVQMVKAGDPESLILVVHLEEDASTLVPALEIGKDLLAQTYLDETYINATEKKQPPFIVLIGCETSNPDFYAFDTVSQLMQSGAAIVLSNFTVIRGDHAAAIVMELITLLRQYAGSPISCGEIVLKLRQKLLAKGIMASLALLAHGDADWQVKT
jgi:hypothetical protein